MGGPRLLSGAGWEIRGWELHTSRIQAAVYSPGGFHHDGFSAASLVDNYDIMGYNSDN